MSGEEWAGALTAAAGRQVRRVRQERGMTAAELSETCARLGLEVPSRTITNWETGKRATISITDLFVVAEALGVPPISILFPLDQDEPIEVLPGREEATWDALAWFTDEAPLEQSAEPGTARAVLDQFRSHAAAVHTALTSLGIRESRQRQPGANLQYADAMLADDLQALGMLREVMRADGLAPPPIPARLRHAWDIHENGVASSS